MHHLPLYTHNNTLQQPEDFASFPRSRRHFLWSLPVISTFLTQQPKPAEAALVQFPQSKPFANKYHLIRAGETLLEKEDIWSTNPLFLTNRDDALSTKGQEQIVAACNALKARNQFPTVVRYSLAASSVDTANIVGRELKLGRDRLGAEFTFLDPRAIGQWDMLSKSEITPAVWAMDDLEAGADGTGARPPPNVDGTPHETLGDQMIRLRQLISLLETQYSGDTVLLVFPDGTGPAVLSAMIAGIPLNRVHELEFEPGEVRLDVDMASVQELWRKKQESVAFDSYQSKLKQGRLKLEELRKTESFSNLKDQRIEAERLAIEEQYNLEQAAKRKALEEKLEREKKERLEAVRESRQRREQMQAAREREQLQSAPSFGDNNDDASVAAIAGGSFVTVLAATQLGKASVSNDVDSNTILKNETGTFVRASPPPPVADSNTTSSDDTTAPALSSYFGSSTPEQAATALESEKSTSTAASVVVEKVPVNGSSGTLEQEIPVDPYAAAQKAMDDYINQDDGGDAWLLSLGEMMMEEEPPETEHGINQTQTSD